MRSASLSETEVVVFDEKIRSSREKNIKPLPLLRYNYRGATRGGRFP